MSQHSVPADLLCLALVCFPQRVSVSTVGCEPTLLIFYALDSIAFSQKVRLSFVHHYIRIPFTDFSVLMLFMEGVLFVYIYIVSF